MDRVISAILVLMLFAAGAAAEEPATPEEQFKVLLKKYDDAFQEYAKAYREAKSPEEQQRIVQEKYPWPVKYAAKSLQLAEQNPREPFAESALIWIITSEYRLSQFRPWYEHTPRYEMIRILTGGGRRWGVLSKEEQEIRDKTIDMLLRDHVASAKLGRVVEMLGASQDKKSATLLRAVFEKNPDRAIMAEACVALARQTQARVALLKRLKDDPQAAKSFEQDHGKEFVEELRKTDQAKLEAEAERLYVELAERYLPEMKRGSAAMLCQWLQYTTDSEQFLRVLYTRGKRDEIRGAACLVLAQALKGSADEKKRQESEKLFEEAAERYADVKTAFDGPVGKRARSELHDLRHLSVGKTAPAIEGTDQDGKHFKLSDYQGKVVLLDFWSEF